jgi:hypothetical protein
MTDAEHAQVVAKALIAEGYGFVRDVRRDPGQFAMLFTAPNGSPDLDRVREIVKAAGYEFAPEYPVWLPLRKLVAVSCESPTN